MLGRRRGGPVQDAAVLADHRARLDAAADHLDRRFTALLTPGGR